MNRKSLFLVCLCLTSLILISANVEVTHKERVKDLNPTQLNTLHTIDNDWVTDWTTNAPPGTNIEVLGSYSGQASVLHLDDSSGGTFAWATHSFGRNIISGRVTVKILVAQNTSQEIGIFIRSEGVYKVALCMTNTGWFNMDYGGIPNPLDDPTGYLGGVWYEVGIEFDCTSNTTKTYINGVEKSSDVFASNATFLDALHFSTAISGGTGVQGDYYIAWIDYSWVQEPIPAHIILVIAIFPGIFIIVVIIAYIRRRGQNIV